MANESNEEEQRLRERLERPGAVSPQREGLSVATLRRSATHHTPTRTLRLSEQEHQQEARENTPPMHRVTVESLLQRPRSNQRNRTPRRNESPLDPNEFRRESARRSAASPDGSDGATNEPRRITIRPGAGGAVGAVASLRIREEDPEKSAKQGPSHRKVRRWNNDHFDSLAAEIAPSSRAAAEVLLRGKEHAHLYKSIYDPADNKSETMKRFIEDGSLRNRFFECELPNPPDLSSHRVKPEPRAALSGEEMLYRVDSRLRKVLSKACSNSYPAARVVKTFETFIVDYFQTKPGSTTALVDDWWQDILLESPTVNKRRDGKITAQFYFDPTNATGGFHRLLLHAVCQYHGLTAVSRMVQISIGQHSKSRALSVTGPPVGKESTKFPMLQVLTTDGVEIEALGNKLEDTWTVV